MSGVVMSGVWGKCDLRCGLIYMVAYMGSCVAWRSLAAITSQGITTLGRVSAVHLVSNTAVIYYTRIVLPCLRLMFVTNKTVSR